MKEYGDSTYGDQIAEIYDEFYSDYDLASIELLADLAGTGFALELGIGTGRIALSAGRTWAGLDPDPVFADFSRHGTDAGRVQPGQLDSEGAAAAGQGQAGH